MEKNLTPLLTEASNDSKWNSMTDEFLRSNYVPDVYQKDIYSIDYDLLKINGINTLSFDIDETIAGNKEQKPDKTVITLFENLKQKGFKIILLTNANYDRAKIFIKDLNLPCIYNAKKPLMNNFNKILNINKIKPNQMIHIGNNQFDDVAGGNSTGIFTCLIENKSGTKKPLEEQKLQQELIKRKIMNYNKFYQFKKR